MAARTGSPPAHDLSGRITPAAVSPRMASPCAAGVEYPTYYAFASSVFKLILGSRDRRMIFAERDRAVTDVALLPGRRRAVLAAIEPPGNSNQVPIPGKLKMLESSDLKTVAKRWMWTIARWRSAPFSRQPTRITCGWPPIRA